MFQKTGNDDYVQFFKEQIKKKKAVEDRAETIKMMFKIKSEESSKDAQYIYLQKIDGIKPEERKKLEQKREFSLEFSDKEENSDNLLSKSPDIMDSDSFLLPDASVCSAQTKEACQSILQHILTFVPDTEPTSGSKDGSPENHDSSGNGKKTNNESTVSSVTNEQLPADPAGISATINTSENPAGNGFISTVRNTFYRYDILQGTTTKLFNCGLASSYPKTLALEPPGT